jgi:hypothetical protein
VLLLDHVMLGLLWVPPVESVAVAEYRSVSPTATDPPEGETETDVTVGVSVPGGVIGSLPPQAVRKAKATMRCGRQLVMGESVVGRGISILKRTYCAASAGS